MEVRNDLSSTLVLKDDRKVRISGKGNGEFKKLKPTKRPSCALRLLPPTWLAKEITQKLAQIAAGSAPVG